ncbi:unnamed protein product [Parascedosporium putredinis]|uniref:Uncharacterized protein n=1 Tax=Parascedosporium putredinis TaxID=1442378 RepID=A0A9P1H545_9PEZI|nr:unnamed protein product [Parascedosporium putredinis]CAI7997476.1 unnamed protein product [Parascedosporium putredinis]
MMVTLSDRQDWYAWDQMIRSHIRDARLEGVILEDQNPRGSRMPASILKELVTPEGYETYLQDMTDLERRSAVHQRQEDAYLRIKNIFLRTVSERLQPRYLHDDKDLRHWYRSLHDNAVGTRVEQQLSIREEYRKHLSVTDPKATSSWEHWLDQWQDIMAKAAAVNLQEGETAAFWIADLRKIFRGIIPHWSETVGLTFDEEIENNTLQPRRIARQLRALLGHRIVTRPPVFEAPSWFIFKPAAAEYYQKRREEDPTWAAEVDREIARRSSK